MWVQKPRGGAKPVGAPLVTPGAGGTTPPPQWETRRTGQPTIGQSRRKRQPRPPSGRHECRPYVGGPWETPWGRTVGNPRVGANPRRGATCDARCRRHNTPAAPGNPPAPGSHHRAIPRNGNPARTGQSPARHPGDMNVAPTWADRGNPPCGGKPRRGATCDARCRRHNTPAATGNPPAPGNPPATAIPPATGHPRPQREKMFNPKRTI